MVHLPYNPKERHPCPGGIIKRIVQQMAMELNKRCYMLHESEGYTPNVHAQ